MPEQRLGAYPHQLSGGQRQRVMIAMALANEPDLLIADEPTTALDVTVQAQILTLLKELQARLGMAMLFITHDLGIVRRSPTGSASCPRARSSRQGPTEAIFADPQHAYTSACSPPSRRADRRRRTRRAPIVIEAEDLKVWFPIKRGLPAPHGRPCQGGRRRRSSRCAPAQTLGIVGESGSGKTTLGLALLRLIRAEGRSPSSASDIDGAVARGHAAAARATCRSSSRTRIGSLVAAHVGRPRSSPKA